MALIVKDRVKQQTTTTGTGTYTLSGSFDSFQTFAEIGDGNTTYYCCTDGTDFEIGIGTYTASGTTLARTTILQSSNSDAAVNWTSGTRTIFCTQPADKAVFFDASDNIELGDGQEIRLGDSDDLKIYHDGSNSYIQDSGTGGLVLMTTGPTIGLAKSYESAASPFEWMVEAIPNGSVKLRYDSVQKFSTTSSGIDVIGTVTDDGATHDGDVTFNGDSYNVVWDKSDNALEFADNAKASFGADGDLIMFHSGTASVIRDTAVTAARPLYLQSNETTNGVVITKVNAAETMAKFIPDGAVELYYDNVKKLETKSDGVDITGELQSDSLDVDGNADISGTLTVDAGGSAGSSVDTLILDSSVSGTTGSGSRLRLQGGTGGPSRAAIIEGVNTTGGGNGHSLRFYTNESTQSPANRMTISHGGDVTIESGNLELGDDQEIRLGDSGDLRILHDGGNSYIIDDGDGDLFLRASNNHYLQFANSEYALLTTENGGVELRYNNEKRFETQSNGFGLHTTDVSVEVTDQSGFGVVEVGGSAGALIDLKRPKTDDYDMRISVTSSDGSTGNIISDDLHLRSKTGEENYLDATLNGAVNLYYDNVKKLETTANGIDVAADTDATAQIGRAHIGYMGFGDYAGFSHVDQNGTTTYALLQHSGGSTYLNTTTGSSIFFRVANTDTMTMNSAGLHFNAGKVITFEGTTADDHETTLTAGEPTADRTITLPDATGTVLLSDSGGDITFEGDNYNVVWDKSDNALELADNAKLKFGAGDDMAIFSDGTYGRIDTNQLIIRGTDTDDKPQIYFQSYNTSNVVDYDTSTSFYFQGPNDAGEQVTYNTIHSVTLDVSDGTEDGRIQFSQLQAGATESTYIFDPYYFLLMSEQQLAWYQYNGSYSTYINPITPTANRFIKLPDRDGVVQVVDRQVMTADLAVGWHTIAVFQGRDDSGDANQRFHAKFTLLDYTSSRHQAFTFYAQSMFGRDEGLQVIGNSTFGTDVVTAIRIKSSADGNGLYAGAAVQVYVADATNNLILYLDEADFDGDESGTTYGNVILKTGVADANDPGDVGYSTATWSTFAEDVQIGINSIEPGGIGVTGNLLTQSNIVLEGATADAHETIITATDATADRTITLPDATGTVVVDADGATIDTLYVGRGASSVTTNTAVGVDALSSVTTGLVNTAVGYDAGEDITTGERNTLVGFDAGTELTTGSRNTSIGHLANANATTASNNTVAGSQALQSATTGSNNTVSGYLAAPFVTTGSNNNVFGYQAFFNATTAAQNVAIGASALRNSVAGNGGIAIGHNSQYYANDTATAYTNTNTSVGYESLRGSTTAANNTGVNNTALGFKSIQNNSSGTNNTGVGTYTLQNNTTGGGNVAVGESALLSNTTASNNTAVGLASLYVNTTGTQNTAVGNYTLDANTTGSYNTAAGYAALSANTTANSNTAFGYAALYVNTSGNNNVAVGKYALEDNTTANNNTAVGVQALLENTTGNSNTAVGLNCLDANTAAGNNVGVGVNALTSNTTGANNVSVGRDALHDNTIGINNVGLGYDALNNNTTGSGNFGAAFRTSGNSYAPVFDPTTESNRIVMGHTSVTNAYVQVAWTVVSDKRDKTQIAPLEMGLDFVQKLNPVSYKFRADRSTEETVGNKRYGFLAQDVLALEGDDNVIVDNEDPDKLKMTNEELIPVLVKAIQEQQTQISELKAEIKELKEA